MKATLPNIGEKRKESYKEHVWFLIVTYNNFNMDHEFINFTINPPQFLFPISLFPKLTFSSFIFAKEQYLIIKKLTIVNLYNNKTINNCKFINLIV